MYPKEVDNSCREAHMPGWLWMVLLLVGYVVLTQWLLPKLGVPT